MISFHVHPAASRKETESESKRSFFALDATFLMEKGSVADVDLLVEAEVALNMKGGEWVLFSHEN